MIPRYPYLHVDVSAEEAEEVSVLLFELGAQGVEERDATTLDRPTAGGAEVTLVASFATDAEAQEAMGELAASYSVQLVHVEGDAWRDAWKAHFKPTRIGKRLVVRPSWEEFAAAPGDVVLTLDPGRAFGTGTHETTRLVLQALEARIRGGERVLDVGSGSGILAIAALLLGAAEAVCIDDDADTLHVAEENAAANGVRLSASTELAAVTQTFPLVLANIEARVLIPLAPALVERLEKGGQLVLSGVLREQADEVSAAYPRLSVVETLSDGEWVALVMAHRD